MKAMVLRRSGTALTPEDLPIPLPGRGEVRVSVEACAVCRTDLHVVDGDLAHPKLPLVPGHEIVGKVDALGSGVHAFEVGERVGIPWLGHTCGQCSYCCTGRENLCDAPLFTGTRATAASPSRRSLTPHTCSSCPRKRIPSRRRPSCAQA